ncbi:general secretion pathway protein GspB [Thermomonas sp.]|uniref:general secretion pathway protein GspB n=1 Tax=Thermomonas sp. TaxID=1971895 RepID=UPI0035B16FBE
MSLILEALRKSEAERRRDTAPGIDLELPPPAATAMRSAPRWPGPVLAGALVLALLALWVGLRRTMPVDPATGTVATPAAAPAGPAMADMPRVVPRSTASAPSAATMAAPAATTPVALRDASLPSAAPPGPAPAPVSPATPRATALPTADEVPDIAATALPPVKLSMHMWDADPARRFVILDGQRLAEGDRSGGLTVVAIDRRGVVIERDGQRARVPLP